MAIRTSAAMIRAKSFFFQDVGDDKGDAHTYREDSWRSGGEAQDRQADAKAAALRCVSVSLCLCLCLCLFLCLSVSLSVSVSSSVSVSVSVSVSLCIIGMPVSVGLFTPLMGPICLYLHNIRSEEQGELRESEQQLRQMRSSSSSPLDSEKEHEETEEIDYLKDTIKSMAHRQVCASVCVCERERERERCDVCGVCECGY